MLKDCGDCQCAGCGVPNLLVVEDCSQCSNPGCMKKENADKGEKPLWCSHYYSAKYCLKECQSARHKQHAQRCYRDMIRNINHKEETTNNCGICMCPVTTANFETLPFYYSCCDNVIWQGCLYEFSSRKYTTVHTVMFPG